MLVIRKLVRRKAVFLPDRNPLVCEVVDDSKDCCLGVVVAEVGEVSHDSPVVPQRRLFVHQVLDLQLHPRVNKALQLARIHAIVQHQLVLVHSQLLQLTDDAVDLFGQLLYLCLVFNYHVSERNIVYSLVIILIHDFLKLSI